MTTNRLHPSLIECQAYVEGISTSKVKTLVSAKSLPADGRSYRTMCKWPRQTAMGYDDRGEFWWATVTRNGDDVFISPAEQQANTTYFGNHNCGCSVLLLPVLWVSLWIVVLDFFQSWYEVWMRGTA